MSSARLEAVLRNFAQVATRVRAAARRQTWRFEFDSRTYYLYFYPRRAAIARLIRGNPAQQEFFGLQTLQKASIPSPRAIAQLSGFRLKGELGDAVIVEGIEPSRRLDWFLLHLEIEADPVPNRRLLALQLRTILHQLGRSGLGHDSLDLSSFLVVGDDRIYLRDGGVRHGGMRQGDVMRLAHSAARFATRSELRRAWDLLMPGVPVPQRNPQSPRRWRDVVRRVFGENELFGSLRIGAWRGAFTRRSPFARRWAISSRLDIKHDDWQRLWPDLVRQIESGQLLYLKRDASGEVMSADITLAGTTVPIIIKRPMRKVWYRYILDLVRPARARRTWRKAWQAIVRNLPTEWPLLLMEKRVLGYVTDNIIVFERVPGVTLDQLDLDALPQDRRRTLFHRLGRTLRKLEQSGLAHYDAKSTNWIIVADPKLGPLPVMIDLDGIRPLSWKLMTFGIQRLLRAMRQHRQYNVEDSLVLCRGFAPYSPMQQEESEVVT